MLLTWNNLSYYQSLMAGIRSAIEAGAYAGFMAETEAEWARGDIPASDPARGGERGGAARVPAAIIIDPTDQVSGTRMILPVAPRACMRFSTDPASASR